MPSSTVLFACVCASADVSSGIIIPLIAFDTNSVVASYVELLPSLAVGAVGVPVNAGDTKQLLHADQPVLTRYR